jgi:hypothetical protein
MLPHKIRESYINFSLHHCVQTGSGAHPMGIGAVSLGVKRPGREAYHSSPPSAKIKNAWSYTSTPQYAFMTWCSERQEKLYLYTFYIN